MPEPIIDKSKDNIDDKLNKLPKSDPMVDSPLKDKPGTGDIKPIVDKPQYDPKELEMGIKDESEHKATIDWIKDYVAKHNNEFPPYEEVYKKIAENHLDKDLMYYTHQKENESKLVKVTDKVHPTEQNVDVGTIKSNLGKREGIEQKITVNAYEGVNPENNDTEIYTIIENFTYPEKVISFYIKNEKHPIPELVSRSNIEIDSTIPEYCKEIETIEGLSDNIKKDIENSKVIMQEETHDMDYENKERKRILKSSKKDEDTMIEKLAEYAHSAWSGWMKYQRKKSKESKIGEIIVPKDSAERWERQMNTEYNKLPEKEKESDRDEAKKILKIFKEIINNEIKGNDKSKVEGKVDKMTEQSIEIKGKKYTGISDGKFIYLNDIDAEELGMNVIELHPDVVEAKIEEPKLEIDQEALKSYDKYIE
jgi:hypothetical protein